MIDACRDADARVAREVMGYEVEMVQIGPTLGGVVNADLHYRKSEGPWQLLPRYSTDISAAMLVVDWMYARRGYQVDMTTKGVAWPDDWRVTFSDSNGGCWASGTTLPLAICRAAIAEAGRRVEGTP